ncbi:MAG TPA: NAD(P)/FAD-dependent oxidoreductase [Chitinophagales bacterium]|jgi:cation diffusion facilitator CzcD-associated flavoprotein CzcO|nr:NAD(P)/FAD-dependent oxidoreductase [Chitinophagales bacterium]MBP6154743.1 NAD(P)/FAD-dependent oxidoreductase [Chitinophagales bacterium]HQV78220.1 NAD(P)/FAD-dependent oxidoreductase [Chitinophagales bacterium]HQW79417.1 NAD(P)/FAD-dependent oxidoreductase [Chitinophagales bacterium]HRB66148.1 NAD(P)/FAD-dependent oxidoreductase [Chitinophagales bacterium]
MNSKIDAEVIVIGSGFAGIGAGIELKNAGFSFLILERATEIGGTWRDNQYPGIAVDITSFTYSYSFEQNPKWNHVFAKGKELFLYAHHCVEKYGISNNFIFGVDVEKAYFDENQAIWNIQAKDGRQFKSNIIISATGALTDPKFPEIKGIENFKGDLIHTARWNNTIDLKNKRVAVIGTGATSVQLVPSIAPEVKHLSVFQRTPIWILPKPDTAIPKSVQSLFSRIPFTQQAIRVITDKITETVMVTSVVHYKQVPFLVKAFEQLCLNFLRLQVNKKTTREALTPKYGFGCKRPSFSNNYLATFNRKNVDLITESIQEITPNGIKTNDGKEHKIEVLIAATGFNVMKDSNYLNYQLMGKNKNELGHFWSNNRLQAYQGCAVPNYPNFFIIFGPYSASGLSWFNLIEIQLTHILRVLNEKRKRNALTVEIKQEEHDSYFQYILEKQKNTVFYNNNCGGSNSYYFDKFGDAPFLRPLSVHKSKTFSQTSDLNHYNYR